MGNPDVITAIVVGAIVGLLFVALGHAQMVWLARRRRARGPDSERSSPLRTLLFWSSASVAAACLVHGASTRTLPARRGFLVGEDLFSVRPRPGLIAKHETRSATVHRGDPLFRFTGPDGEEGQLAIRNRRQLLDAQLEAERTRPLDFDAETARRADAAQATLREREQRVKQLVSERDAIVREVMQQNLAITNRRFRLEQDARAAERELDPLQASLETERGLARSEEKLAEHGWVSRMDAARERDVVNKLEGRVRGLEDARSIFAREKREVDALGSLTQKTLERQLDERADAIASETAEIENARKVLDQVTAVLEQDRPRAMAQRQKRLHELESQIQDCDELLGGGGRQSVVEAPWDGRIGFREPSPASVPADNGPLLVLYRPGAIGTTVSLEPDEANVAPTALRAEIEVASASPGPSDALGRPEALPGAIARMQWLADGTAELGISCDPPDRVVRQLAMGGSVPVVVRLRRAITSTTSFRLGVGFGALALGVQLFNVLRRRPRRRPGESRDAGPPTVSLWVPTDGGPGPTPPGWPGATHAIPGRRPVAALLPPVAPGNVPADTGPAPESTLDVVEVRQLGMALRMQLEGGVLEPGLLHRVNAVLAEHGRAAALLLGAVLGPTVYPETIERVALGLLATAPPEALGGAIRGCAEFLYVMRAIGTEHAAGVLDRLRLALIIAALDTAERQGASGETAATLVKPLVEA
jgi:hypothetical protein